MKTFLLTATYLVGIGELILAIFFWVTHSKSEIRKVMAFLVGAVGLWALSNTGFGIGGRMEEVLPYFFGAVILTTLFHLTLIYPIPIISLDRFHRIALYAPVIFFGYAILFTQTVIDRAFINKDFSNITIGGELFIFFTVYLSLLFFGSVFVLAQKLKRFDGMHNKNVQIFLAGLVLGGLPAIILAVFNLFEGTPYNHLYGPMSSAIWLGAIIYIINRK